MQSDVNFPLILCKPTSQIIQPKFNQCKRFILHHHFPFTYLTISILGSSFIFGLSLKYTLRFVPSNFFIRTSTPPAEMVFFEGDFYTARVALENLVRSANHRVIIIDGYVSSLALSVLDGRKPEVSATVYTAGVGQGMQRLMDEHDRLFPDNHIDIRKWRNESHDRWLIIDDRLYHCGHSLNANGGHKISAITLMGTSPEVILSKVE